MSAEQYARAVAYQRNLGLSQVRVMLDGLCEQVGLGYMAWRFWPDALVLE